MQRQTRHVLTVLLPLIILMPILLSCTGGVAGGETAGDGGHMGSSLSLAGPIYYMDKTAFQAGVGSGTITFSMLGTPVVDLVSSTVTNANFTQVVGVPTGLMSPWATIIGSLPSFAVSDGSANGFVINDVTLDRTSPLVDSLPIIRINFARSTMVFYAYADRDVTLTASGAYTAPDGNAATVDMDLVLKTGWNRCILTRTGTTGSYVDAWRVGDEPADVCWAYGWT